MIEGELRHAWTNAVSKKRTFPVPSSGWQAREYERLMGRPPPENQDSWQFSYTGRTKADKARFAGLTPRSEDASASTG